MKEDVKKLVIGKAEHIDTDIGPIKDANTRRELFEYIKLLESSGYNTLIGGEIKEEFLLPTILEDKREKTKLSIQEMYGPVMVLHKVKSFHDICVEYYKRSSLQSSIYSNDSHEVMEFVNYNKWCGNICVNYGPALRIDSLPFGGLFDENEGKECLDNIVKIVAKEQLVIQEGNNEEIL